MHLIFEVPHLADEHLLVIDDRPRLWTVWARWCVYVYMYVLICVCVCVCCRRTVVCPIIDVISDDTFEYMAGSDMTYGGFNWKLNFRWYPVPQREMDRRKGDRTLPVRLVTQCEKPSTGWSEFNSPCLSVLKHVVQSQLQGCCCAADPDLCPPCWGKQGRNFPVGEND